MLFGDLLGDSRKGGTAPYREREDISNGEVQKKPVQALLLPEGLLPKTRKQNEDGDVTGEGRT